MVATARWYVIRVQSGREDRVRDTLLKRIKAASLDSKITRVIVPVEKMTEIKGGKKKITQRKIYPGYLLLEASLDDQDPKKNEEVWFLIRETHGFGDFVGSHGHPTPMGDDEVAKILGQMTESEESPKLAIGFKKGDTVKIKEGPFEGFDGLVDEVNTTKGTVKVIVTIFGRATPVDLEYWQVESI